MDTYQLTMEGDGIAMHREISSEQMQRICSVISGAEAFREFQEQQQREVLERREVRARADCAKSSKFESGEGEVRTPANDATSPETPTSDAVASDATTIKEEGTNELAGPSIPTAD